LLTLGTDQSKEFKEDQKEKFGIDNEEYEAAKALEKQSRGDSKIDPDAYFKYDEKFIAKYDVL
jgi:hypothetical protein